MRRNSLLLLALTLCPAAAGAEYNFFTGGKVAPTAGAATAAQPAQPAQSGQPAQPAQPVKQAKPLPAPPAVPLPIPPAPPTQPIAPAPAAPVREQERQPRAADRWTIVGMVNGQVTLADGAGRLAIVADGSKRDGCVVRYPEFDCGSPEARSPEKAGAKAEPREMAPKPRYAVPAWYAQGSEKAVTVNGLGELHAVTGADGTVSMLRAPKSMAARIRRELVKYLVESVVTDEHIFCRTSKLMLEEGK